MSGSSLTGPSGAGKSSLLGAAAPVRRARRAGPIDGGRRRPGRRSRPVAGWPRSPGCRSSPHLFAHDRGRQHRAGPARRAARATSRRAARLAGADEFIRPLPGGYDTPLAERGLRPVGRAAAEDRPGPGVPARRAGAAARRAHRAPRPGQRATQVMAVDRDRRWRTAPWSSSRHRPPRGQLAPPPDRCCSSRAVTDAASRDRRAAPIGPGWRRRRDAPGVRRDPLLRLLRLARPLRGRLLLAVAAGAAATGCAVALLAVSGFLLARASQHPSIVAISAAVVAVRALSVGRGRLPLPRAAGLPRRRVPGPGRRPGQHLPAAGTAGPGRAGRVPLRRPAGPADLRRGRHAGPVHPRHRPAAGRGAGRRGRGRRVPVHPGARRGVLAAGLLVAGVGVPLLAAVAAARRAARATGPGPRASWPRP